LKKVVAIYPHIPLPDLSFHAPILPEYPDRSIVQEIVTLGCHQGALFSPTQSLDCAVSFLMIKKFLEDEGAILGNAIQQMPVDERTVLNLMDQELAAVKPTVRHTHSNGFLTIVRKEKGDCLNQFHLDLASKYGRALPDEARFLLQIK